MRICHSSWVTLFSFAVIYWLYPRGKFGAESITTNLPPHSFSHRLYLRERKLRRERIRIRRSSPRALWNSLFHQFFRSLQCMFYQTCSLNACSYWLLSLIDRSLSILLKDTRLRSRKHRKRNLSFRMGRIGLLQRQKLPTTFKTMPDPCNTNTRYAQIRSHFTNKKHTEWKNCEGEKVGKLPDLRVNRI